MSEEVIGLNDELGIKLNNKEVKLNPTMQERQYELIKVRNISTEIFLPEDNILLKPGMIAIVKKTGTVDLRLQILDFIEEDKFQEFLKSKG